MTWLLPMVFEVSVALALGFVLGRIWQIRQIRCDELDQLTRPPIAGTPHL
jgi:hypothetical protein